MRSRRAVRHREEPELNITAFMNLMVALVPFLLITAVFSQIAILQLMMPGGSSIAAAEKQELQLELLINKSVLILQNGAAKNAQLAQVARRDGKYDLVQLNEELYKLKQRYPQKLDITLLAQDDTSYDTIIQLMDAIRVRRVSQGMATIEMELFPEISIGDAKEPKESIQ